MKTNRLSLQKKLKAYSALAGTVAAAASANAQVIYTNVSPDSTLGLGGVYNLDLNNDAVADFQIIQQSGLYGGFVTYDGVGIFAMHAANAIDTAGGQGTVGAFPAGFTVDASLNWLDSATAAAISPPTGNGLGLEVPAFSFYGGNFLGQNDKYAALRFSVGANTYYGWVRLDVGGDAKSFVVKDYAYQANPNNSYSITGALVGISEAALQNKVEIFSYNKNITVKLDPILPVAGSISISDVSGRNISETAINTAEMNIPMEQAKTGVYLITVKQASGSYTKRVFVK